MIFRLTEMDSPRLRPPVTVADAISDLPSLKMGEGGEVVPYGRRPASDYARLMRNGNKETHNHYAAVLSPQNVARLEVHQTGRLMARHPAWFAAEGHGTGKNL